MKKIVIVGKGASGKNVLMERLEKRGFRHLVSHTTRPMRKGEKEGVEYHFVSKEEFKKMVSEDKFVESQEFNGNYYGTTKEEWDKSDVMILARKGVDNLVNIGLRDECFIIFVDIPFDIRLVRLSRRGDKTRDEIMNRIESDDAEFEGFCDYDLRITNEDF